MSTVTAERVAAFARTLPPRSAIFVSPGDGAGTPRRAWPWLAAATLTCCPLTPEIPAGEVLGKSWYAISVGDLGRWMDEAPA